MNKYMDYEETVFLLVMTMLLCNVTYATDGDSDGEIEVVMDAVSLGGIYFGMYGVNRGAKLKDYVDFNKSIKAMKSEFVVCKYPMGSSDYDKNKEYLENLFYRLNLTDTKRKYPINLNSC